MLDLNVILDIAQRREPFYSASATALSQAITKPNQAFLPGHLLTTLHYVTSRHAGREKANALVDWLLTHLDIAPQDRSQFMRARGLAFKDFEDAAVAIAAEAAGCEVILTRNVADFANSPVRAVTPEEFLLDL